MTKRKRTLRENLMARELHKHPFAVPVVTLIVLSFATMVGFIAFNGRSLGENGEARVVQLSADDQQQSVPTRALNVGDFLKRAKIVLHEGDVVEPAEDTKIDANDFHINVYRAKPVTIIDGDKRTQALSAATTPRSIASQVGIKVFPEDRVEQVAPDDILKDQVLGTQIEIDRAVPVQLNVYGTAITVRTHVDTVAELLAEKNIQLDKNDGVKPALTEPIRPNAQIFVSRFGVKIKTVKEPIGFNTKYVDDTSLSFGTTAVRQKGSPGKRLITYQIRLKNGKEVSRKKIQSVRAEDPVPQIIARGKALSIPSDRSQLMAQAGISAGEYPYADYIISHESGWCPTKWQGQVGYCPPYYEPIHSSDSGYGYGLCQSTPGSKMASAGGDWQTNPVTQLKWCTGYASRYGGWEGAYNFWLGHGWW